MKQKSLSELEEKYYLELNKIVNEIKKSRVSQAHSASSKRGQSKAKLVLLQFPDGLKQWATTVVDFLEDKTKKEKTEFIIWLGSCYGACDTPTGIDGLKPKIDLVVQFGHNEMMPSYNKK